VIAAAQNRAKVASKSMPDCLGGGIGASSPVWMRDYSQPNDREPKNPKAKAMIGASVVCVIVLSCIVLDPRHLMRTPIRALMCNHHSPGPTDT